MMPSTDQITQGTLRTTEGQPLPLEHTGLSAKVDGPVASVELQQTFRNDTGGPIEAVYLFPLPHEASVYRMTFTIGDRVVEGVIKEKEEAKRTYEAARREGRSATLLEQNRPNLFTLSVANIPSGETIEVNLGYQERLAYDEGEWRFVFPMVAGERYHPGEPLANIPGATDQVTDAGRIRPPRPASGQRRADVSVDLEIRAGRPISPPRSPSHQVVVEPLGEGAFRVRLDEADSIPNRDFVLVYGDPRPGVRAEVRFQREPDRVGTFLLVVTPPAVPLAEETLSLEVAASGKWRPVLCGNCGGALEDAGAVREVPGIGPAYRCAWCGAIVAAQSEKQALRAGMSRDVIFLIDRSASMRGASLPQARRAVRLILDHLGPDDAVQLFAFDHDRMAADGSGEGYLPLNQVTINQLDGFLGGVEARGGTELDKALERAAELPARERRARLVVLVTDAAVGNEGRLLRRVPEILGKETRLYVLGLGPAVNRYLIARLARAGGGASDVLLPQEDVEAVVPRFARRVRQAGPVLRDLKLSWDDALPVDVYPSPIPDLFGGQTIQLLGRFSGLGPSRMILTATTALGEPFRQEVDVTLPETAQDAPGLERLWARLRIDALTEKLEREPGQLSEVRMEVLGLALRHSLLSPYTSLVAEDSEQRVQGEARRVQVAAEEPADGPPAPTSGGSPRPPAAPQPPSPARPMGIAGFVRRSEEPAALSDWADEDLDSEVVEGVVTHTRAGTYKGPPGMSAVDYLAKMSEEGGEMPLGGAPPPAAMPAPGGPPPSLMDEPPAMSFTPPSPPSERMVSGGRKRRSGLGAAIGRLFGKGKAEADEPGPFIDDEVVPEPVAAPPEPSPPSVPSPRQQPAPQEPGPDLGPSRDDYTREMLEFVKGKPIGELDLVFLVDETGSMGPYIEQVKRRLLELIATLERAPLCRSLRLGLVSYRDHPPQDTSFVSRVVPLTDNIRSIKQGVNRMQAAGGGDGPEAVTDGLYDVVRLEWRPRAARVVVWFGDAPPHGVDLRGDGFPQGCPCGHHWYTQAENAREMGIAIHAVGCLPGLARYHGGEEVYRTVARTSRGLYLPLREASLLIPLIVGVSESELDRQRIEEHIAEVIARHERELQLADEQERVRFLTDVLQQQQVQPRSFEFDPAQPSSAALRFRPIASADVEAGLDQLRRLGRTSL